MPDSPPVAHDQTARAVATELSARVAAVSDRYGQGLDEAETAEQVAAAAAGLLALGDEFSAAVYPGVTVAMAHPRLPWFIEVSGTDGVFCVGDLNAAIADDTDGFPVQASEGPCGAVPTRAELDELVSFFSGDPEAFAGVVVNARIESARLTAEATARQVQALVALELGSDVALDGRTERFWAQAADDLAPWARVEDSTGAPVEVSEDLHDRYVVVTVVGPIECAATVEVAAAPGDVPEVTVTDVTCG